MQKWYFHDISVDDNSYNSENKQLYELSGSFKFNIMVTLLPLAKLQEFTSIWVWHLRSFITARVSFDQLIEISFFCVGILFYITFVKLLCSLGTVSYLKCCTIKLALRWNISSPIFIFYITVLLCDICVFQGTDDEGEGFLEVLATSGKTELTEQYLGFTPRVPTWHTWS